VIAHINCWGLQACKVGAGVGLAITLAPADFTADDGWQEFVLLFFAAIFQQCRPQHRYSKAVQRTARVDTRHFLLQDFDVLTIQPTATVLFWPGRCSPALFTHALQPQTLGLALEFEIAATPTGIFFRTQRTAHFCRAVFFQPGANFCSKSVQIFTH